MKEQKDKYEIFLKVCETGSFSGAAEALKKEARCFFAGMK